ncbi:MAG: hypothetical protein ACKVH8_20965 [Pirellulales bacterium]|jgi:gas vesicle protein
MSVGPMGGGIVASLAASQLAQNSSSEVNKNQQETNNQARQVDASEKAEKATGVGDPEQSEQTSDRDADGRRLLERSQNPDEQAIEENSADTEESKPAGAKDPTGQRGGTLDLSG